MHNAHRMVAMFQTPAERQAKYALARSCGANKAEATRLRDWNWYSIRGYLSIDYARRNLNFTSVEEKLSELYKQYQ